MVQRIGARISYRGWQRPISWSVNLTIQLLMTTKKVGGERMVIGSRYKERKISKNLFQQLISLHSVQDPFPEINICLKLLFF